MNPYFDVLRKNLDLALKWLSGGLLGVMVTVIFLQVIYRYVFKAPLAWSEELARFLFIWVSFIGGALAAMRGGHISVTIFVDLLGDRWGRVVRFVSCALTSSFFGLTVVLTLSVFGKLMRQNSPAMELPIAYPYLGIVIGSALMCLFYAIYAVRNLRAKK